MPYAVLVGTPDDTDPTFVIPHWTWAGAAAEVKLAVSKRGVGFIFTPLLSLPGKVYDDHLWACARPVSWPAFLRWKLTGHQPTVTDPEGGASWPA